MPPPHTYRPPRQSVPSAGEDRVQQGRARRSRACPFRQGIGALPSPTHSSCRARGTRVPRSRFDRSAPATRAFRGRGPMAGCFQETAEWLLETPKHLLKTSKCLPQSFSPYPQNPRSEKSVAPKYKKPDETDKTDARSRRNPHPSYPQNPRSENKTRGSAAVRSYVPCKKNYKLSVNNS